jgi:RNA polymerase sigma factor (sigma-70 family)
MTPRTTTLDVDVSRHQEEIDRQRAAWMAAAQVGDRVAYEKLVHDCIPLIKRVARGQGTRFDCIGDVEQETLLTVHQARHTYDPNRSFAAWLTTIAQRRAIDGLRRATQTREVHAPLAYLNHSDSSGHPEETVSQTDHAKLLNSALDKLSVRQREAVEHLALQSQSLAQTDIANVVLLRCTMELIGSRRRLFDRTYLQSPEDVLPDGKLFIDFCRAM